MATLGIDVSEFQGRIDWDEVKRDNIHFAILRAGYGRFQNQRDRYFERNYRETKRIGLPAGVYLFSYATTTEDAREEARNLLRWLEGKEFEYPVYYDMESQSQASLSKRELTDVAVAFCEELERAGYFVGIYASEYWLTNKFEHDRIRPYTIWLAQYNDRPTYEGDFDMWQFTSTGTVRGISGHCDMDYGYEDFPKIIKENRLNGFTGRGSSTESSDTVRRKPRYRIYTVKSGDTLSGIASRFGTTWQKLAKYNRLADPNYLYPGQRLRIPD